MSDPVKNANDLLKLQAGFQEIANNAWNIFNAFLVSGFKRDEALYMASQWTTNLINMSIKGKK